jgi:hypothetical protein
MNRHTLVHEIRLGAVRAQIWEEPSLEHGYRVGISRVVRPGERPVHMDRFDAEDLALVAEVADLAHLWICEQAELIA